MKSLGERQKTSQSQPYPGLKQAMLSSLGSGVLLGLAIGCFSPAFSPLTWFALTPLLLSFKSANRFARIAIPAYLTCLVALVFALYAFLPAFFIGGALLIIIGALHFALPFFALYLFQSRLGWRGALWLLPLLWPVWEWFFLQSKLSLPLMAIYTSQAAFTWLVQYIDVLGYNAISTWLLLLNVLITFAIDGWRRRLARRSSKRKRTPEGWATKVEAPFLLKRLGAIAAAMFLPPLLYAAYVQATLPTKLGGEVKVSLVQVNTPSETDYNDSTAVRDMVRHSEMTDSLLASARPDLVVWPEGAVPRAILTDKQVRDFIFTGVAQWQTPLLTGTLDVQTFRDSTQIPPLQRYLQRDYEIYNAAILITPQLAWHYLKENLDVSRAKIYRKENLMPFTESVPFSETWPALSRLTLDLGDGANFSAGKGPKTLLFATQTGALVQVSPIICWDLFYATSTAEAARSGATFIAALTDESRLGKTNTALQMEWFTRLRSIETRRAIVKCSPTGYSLFCDPFGRVYAKAPWWRQQVATANVQLSSVATVFSRHPGYFPKGCLIAVALVAVLVLPRRFKPMDSVSAGRRRSQRALRKAPAQ